MERRDQEDGIHWSIMADSPEQHHHEDTYPQNPSLRNHFSQNPTSQNHLYQNPYSEYRSFQDLTSLNQLYQNPFSVYNPNSQDHLPQIPITNQNHHNTILLQNPLQFNGGVQVNPSLNDAPYGQSLETSLSRLNLSSPSRFRGNNSFSNPSIDMGYSEGAVRRQIGGVTLRSNSTPFEYRNIQNGGQNLVAAMNRSSSSWPNISNDSSLQHRSLSANEIHDYATYCNGTSNGTRNDSRFQRSRPRSNYGLDSDSVNVLMSSLHNHQDIRPRRRRPSYSLLDSLEELKGRMSLEAKDQQGCRFLQEMVEERRPEDIEMIFLEVKGDLHELIVHPVANYLIQKLIKACNEEQMTELILSLVNDEEKLLNICAHSSGTRAIQKLLEYVTTRHQRSLLISALKGITLTLTKSIHGHHVIEQCVKQFSNEETMHLLDEIAENCLDLATDKSGCCVVQQCLTHTEGEPMERLIAEITANTQVLSEHPYGNYVVQYLLGMKLPHATANVLAQLRGNYVNLSMNKYGSNVVEHCLKELGEEQTTRIIREFVKDPSFLKVLQDPYGNFVVQTALSVTKGYVHNNLVSYIQFQYQFLHSHPYGKRVLAKARGNKYRV